jgi:competence protein ComEA
MRAARTARHRVGLAGIALALFCLWVLTPASPLQRLSAGVSADVKADLIDINRASLEDLKTLPGIRDAWAGAIVKNRPYKKKTQLLTRKILPFTAYKSIEGKIIAKQ